MRLVFFRYVSGYHRGLHVLTHSCPTRRSSELEPGRAAAPRGPPAGALRLGGADPGRRLLPRQRCRLRRVRPHGPLRILVGAALGRSPGHGRRGRRRVLRVVLGDPPRALPASLAVVRLASAHVFVLRAATDVPVRTLYGTNVDRPAVVPTPPAPVGAQGRGQGAYP